MMLLQYSVNSFWLFINTQTRVLLAEWSLLENDGKATLNVNIGNNTIQIFSEVKMLHAYSCLIEL